MSQMEFLTFGAAFCSDAFFDACAIVLWSHGMGTHDRTAGWKQDPDSTPFRDSSVRNKCLAPTTSQSNYQTSYTKLAADHHQRVGQHVWARIACNRAMLLHHANTIPQEQTF